MVSPSHKKRAVQYVAEQGMCSTRRACRVVGLATSSYYHRPQGPTDRRQRLEQRIITLSNQHPRWGYRLIHQLLCREGWTVNRKRVQRVRRQAGPRRTTGEQTQPTSSASAACSGAGGLSRPRLVVGLCFRSNHRRAVGEDTDGSG